MIRRQFLRSSMMAGGALMTGNVPAPRYRAAIIGATGRGNYGHGLDVAFQRLPGVAVVAVADVDAAAGERARVRAGAERSYTDWREMLARERPNLLAIGPRWVVDRLAMIRAAADVGAHVYMEKPLAVSLEEADAIVSAAERARIKIALAHQVRLAPDLIHCKKLLDQGLIGDLLELRARGKEDQRAGGEDMMVLGTHCMYMMRCFGGDPLWCTARVQQNGRDVTVEDRREATEPLGPIAGDSIHATFAFPKGVQGHFASQKVPKGEGGRFQIHLFGSKGVAMFALGQDPEIFHLPDPLWSPGKTGAKWQPLPGAPSNSDPSGLTGTAAANKRIVEEMIREAEGGPPGSANGYEGRATLEMILAVYASHLSGARAAFPLKDRKHPLGAPK